MIADGIVVYFSKNKMASMFSSTKTGFFNDLSAVTKIVICMISRFGIYSQFDPRTFLGI